MATPFDSKTWRLRFESLAPPVSHLHPELNQLGYAVESLTASVFKPLKQQTRFCVNVATDHSASVDFDENTPENIRKIWSEAHDVYYDPEFYTVRGDLYYDHHTGHSGGAHSHHFVITYRGKLGPGGTKRELHVALLDEHAAFDPTADLVRARLHIARISTHHRGAWKADD